MHLLVIAAVANVALAYSNTQPLVAWSSSRYPFFVYLWEKRMKYEI